MLTRVTITGADDRVDPNALVDLSAEFPFVEWGVLFSTKRQGEARYPSHEWVVNLMVATSGEGTHLSAHLCGDRARGTLAGDVYQCDSTFQRHQINGFTAPAPALVKLARSVEREIEFILQVRAEEQLAPAAEVARAINEGDAGCASLLWDPSGGRGRVATYWPAPPPGVPMGYAGGIKPSNVADVLFRIGPVGADFWIDMESGVRDGDDRFDLALCREVLTLAQPFVVARGVAAHLGACST